MRRRRARTRRSFDGPMHHVKALVLICVQKIKGDGWGWKALRHSPPRLLH